MPQNETKWTRAPWHATRPGQVWQINAEPDTAHVNPVALGVERRNRQGPGYNSVEVEANAHLIAAAPDLYAALEALVTPAVHMETCASLYDDQGVMVENGSHLCDCGVAAALAALAKARGESPDAPRKD